LSVGSYTVLSLVLEAYAKGFGITRSKSEIRRLIEQGSIKLNDERLTDLNFVPALKPGDVLKLDKTRAVRLA